MRGILRFLPQSQLALFILDLLFVVGLEALVLIQAHERLQLPYISHTALIILAHLLLVIAFLYSVGAYRRDTLIAPLSSISRVPVALAASALVLFGLLNFGADALSRHAFVYRSVSGTSIIVLVASGVAMIALVLSRALFHMMVRRHWFRRRILVVGTGHRAAYLQALIKHDAHESLTGLLFVPARILAGNPETDVQPLHGAASQVEEYPTGGKTIEDLARQLSVDEIVVAADERRGLPIERLLLCKVLGIPVTDYTEFLERETQKIDLSWIDLSRLVYSQGFQLRALDLFLKRVFDVAVSAVILLAFMPLMLIAMAAIYLETGLPIFYQQERVTRFGRKFHITKLRTMTTDAEKEGPRWAAAKDSRVTKVGAILRRTRIDEVPQLFNIFSGSMSLVGPRPERPVFIEKLAKTIPFYDLRHSVRAGLTGWAQINYPYGASEEDAKRKLEYDLYYIKNYSILRDGLILLQTLRVLLWQPTMTVAGPESPVAGLAPAPADPTAAQTLRVVVGEPHNV